MANLLSRATITTKGLLVGWRKLRPDKNAFSGQLRTGVCNKYISYIEFECVTYHPASHGRWREHYLGEKDGVYIMLLFKDQSKAQGPRI